MASHEELDFVVKHGPYEGKRVIEIGSSNDYSAQYRKALKAGEYLGVDMREHKFTDIVHNMDEFLPVPPADAVLCISVLEHSPHPWLVAPNITVLVKPGGLLLLTVPFVWRVHQHPSDYWRFTPEAIKLLFPDFKWKEESTHPPNQRLDRHTKEQHIQLFFAGVKKCHES